MRTHVVIWAMTGVVLTTQAGTLPGDQGKETESERIARLIKQLGDERFARREAASKDLDAIGEPALPSLRKAAASNHDAEIRWRADRIAKDIAARLLAPLARKEIEGLQGTWYSTASEVAGKPLAGEEKLAKHIITANRWVHKNGETVVQSGTLNVIDVTDKLVKLDFIVTAGFGTGDTWLAIYERNGDEMKWCGGYMGLQGLARPTTFTTKQGDGGYFLRFLKREKK